ncbi:histamine H2 receptor-like [Oculina patagonica]
MNASQSNHGTITPDCGFVALIGGTIPPSATEAKVFLIALAMINIVTFPVTAALNAMVIIAVKTKSRLRANKPNILLECLATTDLLVGVIVQPLFAASLITIVLDETTTGSCALQNISQFFTSVLCDTSLLHLALIGGDRYLAMKHTFAYNTGIVTEARLLIASALAWIFSLVLHIPLFFDKAVFFIINNTFIGLSFAMIVFCQITVYREVRRHEKHISIQQVTEEARQKFLKNKKIFQLTAIIILVLFLCYIPIGVVRVIIYRGNISLAILYACCLTAVWVAILNSFLNPLIYSVRMRQFRVAFIELTCRTTNVAEADEIDVRVFGSRNAVDRFKAGQGHEGDRQTAEQANVNNTNNDNNEIVSELENYIQKLNWNSIRKPLQRRHSI